jgi:hypothetical protein
LALNASSDKVYVRSTVEANFDTLALILKNRKAQALDRNEWRYIIGKAKALFGL